MNDDGADDRPEKSVYGVMVALRPGATIERFDLLDAFDDGELWIVAAWHRTPTGELRMPARLVRVDQRRLHLQAPELYLLSDTVPRRVFEGDVPRGAEEDYQVLEVPNG